jgi:hypothetical protein
MSSSDFEKTMKDEFIDEMVEMDKELPDDLTSELQMDASMSEFLDKSLNSEYGELTREIAQSAIHLSMEAVANKNGGETLTNEQFQDVMGALVMNLVESSHTFMKTMTEKHQPQNKHNH